MKFLTSGGTNMLEKILTATNIPRAQIQKYFLPSLIGSILGVVSIQNCSEYGIEDQRYCADKDNDGFGDIRCFDENAPVGTFTNVAHGADPPKRYVTDHRDCNDQNENIHPKATELCNKIDDNCNGQTDEYAQPIKWYVDNDGDGYGSEKYVLDCPAPKKHVNNKDDCDDAKKQIHPGAKDICNLKDDNCNGIIDEYKDICQTTCGKGDLYCVDGKMSCDAPKPQTEICDGKDNDCNGITDEYTASCQTICEKGKVYCQGGKEICDARKPESEICDGKDNDCNGKIDELEQCCINGSIKDSKFCSDGSVLEQKVCMDFKEWKLEVKKEKCWTPLYKWTCENKVIGVVDVNAPYKNFMEKNPTTSDIGNYNNQNGLPQWCCIDKNGKEWGVEEYPANEKYLKPTCSCISKVAGIDDNSKNNPTKNKKSNKDTKEAFDKKSQKFFEQQFQCPPHEYSQEKTSIEVLFENFDDTDAAVWLNWHSYGYPPSERIILKKNDQYRFAIDETMIPSFGTEMQVCTSLQGCSEKMPLAIGERYAIEVGVRDRITAFRDTNGRAYFFQQTVLMEPCLEETKVQAIFRNHKTLDLQPWMNWQQGWPAQEKVMVEPGEEYTFMVTQEMLTAGTNKIALCTSSYGCFPMQKIQCGDHKTYTLDWVFGRIGEKR